MEEIPKLKDWRGLLEKRLSKGTYTEEDVLEILYFCQDCSGEIQPAGHWINQQQAFMQQMLRLFNDLYLTRFNKQAAHRPKEVPIPEIVLDTPEIRKQTIRQVALSLTEPGHDVSDEAVLDELKRLGKKLDLVNPTAAISTVLRGFRPQFEKVQGKRGVFRRRE